MLSVCIQDVIRNVAGQGEAGIQNVQKHVSETTVKKNQPLNEGKRSLAQKIFIILVKILEALSDKDLNNKIDQVILGRI